VAEIQSADAWVRWQWRRRCCQLGASKRLLRGVKSTYAPSLSGAGRAPLNDVRKVKSEGFSDLNRRR